MYFNSVTAGSFNCTGAFVVQDITTARITVLGDGYIKATGSTGWVKSLHVTDQVHAGSLGVTGTSTLGGNVTVVQGASLYLPSTGGTGSALNFYQDNYIFDSSMSGPFSLGQVTFRAKAARVGKNVTLSMDQVDSAADTATFISITGALDAAFRPAANKELPIIVINGGASANGTLSITSAGVLTINGPLSSGGNFTGTSTCGYRGTSVCYTTA
jgi:hypothetical protein